MPNEQETAYWLDLFTGTTWEEFLKAGGTVSGFRHRMRKTVEKIQPNDILLCYLTGVQRWVGALRVIGPSNDQSGIWSFAEFPARLAVEIIVKLSPEQGIPMADLEGKVAFYKGPKDAGKFKAFLRGSPRLFQSSQDGQLIMNLLRETEKNPVKRPVDPRKLARKPLFVTQERRGQKTIVTKVSIPDSEEDTNEDNQPQESWPKDESVTKHTEIQYHLLKLGAEMGLDVWVARNDRSRICKGKMLGDLPRMIPELPTQFNEATNRTIELIDVLWIQGNSIVAAFEIESTTSIYSGLLRMSDLLALQPNLDINLFLVAPEERRGKVEQEILRPTFKLRNKPLANVCGFIGFSDLCERLNAIRKLQLAKSLKPEFLKDMAEYFGEENKK